MSGWPRINRRINPSATQAVLTAITFLAIFWMGSAICAHAQFSSGVDGTVLDSSGAVIPGATITLTDTKLNVTKSATSNQAGYFRIDGIAASTYRVDVAFPSFKTWVQQDLVLQVGEIRTIAPVLQIGAASSTVTVSAAAASVDLTTPTTGTVISQATLQETPLVGQNVFSVSTLGPGLTGTAITSGDNFSNQYDINVNAAGQRQESNLFMMDGAYVSDASRGGEANISPNPEIVQSTQVTTNDFDASKGRDSGAILEVFSNSGTNDLHGTIDYYFTNDSLTARTEFEPSVPSFTRNESGASLGGPVLKNKLFAFGAVDFLRSSQTSASQATVETQQFANYVETNYPDNLAVQLLKTYPPQSYPTTGLLTVAQVEAQTPSYYPLPNIPAATPVVGTINFNASLPRNGYQWSSRGDYYLGAHDRIFGEFLRTLVNTPSVNVRPGLNAPETTYANFANAGWTHTFSPRVVNDAHLFFTRTWGQFPPVASMALPFISIGGATGLSNFGPLQFIINNTGFRDAVSVSVKSHEVRFGIDLENDRNNDNGIGVEHRPVYIFNNLLDFVQDEAVIQSGGTIDLTTMAPPNYTTNTRYLYLGGYIQDDWKVSRRLEVNLGVRYDSLGHVNENLSPPATRFTFGSGSTLNEQIANGVVGPPPNGSKDIVDKNAWEMNPRLGFSLDLFGNGRTAIRGGVGLFSDKPPFYGFLSNAANNPPYAYDPSLSVYQGNSTPTFQLCNPPQGMRETCPYIIPTNVVIDSHGGIVGERASIGGNSPNLTMGQAEDWTLSVQQELRNQLVLEANYSGSASHHLVVVTDINRFAGDMIANHGLLTRLNQSFGTIDYATSNGNSIGNYGSVMLTEHANKGLMVRGNYTWGKVLDVYSTSGTLLAGGSSQIIQADDFAAQRGRSDFDIRQQFSVDGVWELPAPHTGLLEEEVLGGWKLGGVGVFHTGAPATVYTSAPFNPVFNSSGNVIGNTGGDYNADGNDYDVPNAPTFGNHLSGRSKEQFLNGIFAASSFPAPALGQEGNLGRNTYDTPGYKNIDLNAEKEVSLPWFRGENLRLAFRGELYNLFNRVNLTSFDSNLADPLFGHAVGQLPARSVQFHVRAVF